MPRAIYYRLGAGRGVLHGVSLGLVPLRVTSRADGNKDSMGLHCNLHAFLYQDHLAQPTMSTHSWRRRGYQEEARFELRSHSSP